MAATSPASATAAAGLFEEAVPVNETIDDEEGPITVAWEGDALATGVLATASG